MWTKRNTFVGVVFNAEHLEGNVGILEHFKVNHSEYALGHFKTTQAHAHGKVRGVSKKSAELRKILDNSE